MNLDAQRKRFNVVVGAEYLNCDFGAKLIELTSRGWQYFSILHDRDIKDNGELKNKHYHITLVCNKRFRAKQILQALTKIFECNVENIQIEECFSVVASVQYLTHKNDKNKYQYDLNNIYTNLEFNDFLGLYNSEVLDNREISTDSLIDICYSCENRLEIIRKIGIGNYSHYRNTINDILEAINKLNGQ